MKIEYNLYDNYTFSILCTTTIFCILRYLQAYNLMKNTNAHFFQIFYMPISFIVKILLTSRNRIVY